MTGKRSPGEANDHPAHEFEGKHGEKRGKNRGKPKLAVELDDVWAGYQHETILQEVNISIEENEFLAIIGPNGGGKTTFFKVLLGILKPTRGKIRVFGKDPSKARHLIGYVPQYALFDRQFPIDVWNVVLMGRVGHLGTRPFFSDEDRQMAMESLRMVEMDDLKDRQISRLSGGQMQRVFIARALASGPKLLLLDEPTASVDKRMQESIFELLGRLNKTITIILVTHDVGVVSAYVNKIGCLNKYLIYHDDKMLTPEMMEAAYDCPVDIIAHGVPHRVYGDHMPERDGGHDGRACGGGKTCRLRGDD